MFLSGVGAGTGGARGARGAAMEGGAVVRLVWEDDLLSCQLGSDTYPLIFSKGLTVLYVFAVFLLFIVVSYEFIGTLLVNFYCVILAVGCVLDFKGDA